MLCAVVASAAVAPIVTKRMSVLLRLSANRGEEAVLKDVGTSFHMGFTLPEALTTKMIVVVSVFGATSFRESSTM